MRSLQLLHHASTTHLLCCYQCHATATVYSPSSLCPLSLLSLSYPSSLCSLSPPPPRAPPPMTTTSPCHPLVALSVGCWLLFLVHRRDGSIRIDSNGLTDLLESLQDGSNSSSSNINSSGHSSLHQAQAGGCGGGGCAAGHSGGGGGIGVVGGGGNERVMSTDYAILGLDGLGMQLSMDLGGIDMDVNTTGGPGPCWGGHGRPSSTNSMGDSLVSAATGTGGIYRMHHSSSSNSLLGSGGDSGVGRNISTGSNSSMGAGGGDSGGGRLGSSMGMGMMSMGGAMLDGMGRARSISTGSNKRADSLSSLLQGFARSSPALNQQQVLCVRYNSNSICAPSSECVRAERAMRFSAKRAVPIWKEARAAESKQPTLLNVPFVCLGRWVFAVLRK